MLLFFAGLWIYSATILLFIRDACKCNFRTALSLQTWRAVLFCLAWILQRLVFFALSLFYHPTLICTLNYRTFLIGQAKFSQWKGEHACVWHKGIRQFMKFDLFQIIYFSLFFLIAKIQIQIYQKSISKNAK